MSRFALIATLGATVALSDSRADSRICGKVKLDFVQNDLPDYDTTLEVKPKLDDSALRYNGNNSHYEGIQTLKYFRYYLVGGGQIRIGYLDEYGCTPDFSFITAGTTYVFTVESQMRIPTSGGTEIIEVRGTPYAISQTWTQTQTLTPSAPVADTFTYTFSSDPQNRWWMQSMIVGFRVLSKFGWPENANTSWRIYGRNNALPQNASAAVVYRDQNGDMFAQVGIHVDPYTNNAKSKYTFAHEFGHLMVFKGNCAEHGGPPCDDSRDATKF